MLIKLILENLKHLIYDAESKGISFVYAISPGLDIIFSCPKDVQFLRNKLKQVFCNFFKFTNKWNSRIIRQFAKSKDSCDDS